MRASIERRAQEEPCFYKAFTNQRLVHEFFLRGESEKLADLSHGRFEGEFAVATMAEGGEPNGHAECEQSGAPDRNDFDPSEPGP